MRDRERIDPFRKRGHREAILSRHGFLKVTRNETARVASNGCKQQMLGYAIPRLVGHMWSWVIDLL